MPTCLSEPKDVPTQTHYHTKTLSSDSSTQSKHNTTTMTTTTTTTTTNTATTTTITTTMTTTTKTYNDHPQVGSGNTTNDSEEIQSNATCIPVSRPWLNRKAILQDLLQDMEATGDINTLNSFLSNDIPFHGIGQVLLTDTTNGVRGGRKEEGHTGARETKL